MRQYLDLNGNLVHHFEIPNDHSKLMIESRSTMVTAKRVDFESFPLWNIHEIFERGGREPGL